jgi:hypothetical protein
MSIYEFTAPYVLIGVGGCLAAPAAHLGGAQIDVQAAEEVWLSATFDHTAQ